MKLHIPGLPQIVQYAFDKLLNKGIGWDNLADEVWNRFRDQFVGVLFTHTLYFANMPGFILATGAELIRADWPVLWNRVQQNQNIVTDAEWFSQERYYSYSYGDGETTFRIPRAFDFERGYDPASGVPMGQWHQDQMQRITGGMTSVTTNTGYYRENHQEGALSSQGSVTNLTGSGSATPSSKDLLFDSANSPNARTSETTDGETWPCHGVLPKLIYTGEVW